jgi:hypothetical protein
MWFLIGKGGRFHNVFGDRPTKWSIAKKKNHQNMHPQLMDLQESMDISGTLTHPKTYTYMPQNIYIGLYLISIYIDLV